jgi:hypothetical protein
MELKLIDLIYTLLVGVTFSDGWTIERRAGYVLIKRKAVSIY